MTEMDTQNIVVDVFRGHVVENRHRGHVAVVDADGRLLFSYGDPYMVTYGRSALKPFQVLPLLETGAADRFNFDDADISICMASHSGEEQHISRVRSILNRVGLSEGHLKCGIADPLDKQSHEQLLTSGVGVCPACNECSGVHSGMLTTAVHLGEDLSDYHSIRHPVQQRVMQAVADVTQLDEKNIAIAVDGCGIPTYALPLHHIALAYTRLARPHLAQERYRDALERAANAIVARPEMVTGTNTYTTRLVNLFGGRIIAKEGAQGVYGFADKDSGLGVALKIEDGSPTQIPAVVNRILHELEIGVGGELEMLKKDTNPVLKNVPGQIVGQMITKFHLHECR